ncbi:hypothetical protein STXM2123_495 [Streptomyces sp. F-3]|nr:hypothetical protein STXM2123_495 [Streptomyces sp. F-3]
MPHRVSKGGRSTTRALLGVGTVLRPCVRGSGATHEARTTTRRPAGDTADGRRGTSSGRSDGHAGGDGR